MALIFNYKTYPECITYDKVSSHPECFWIPLLGLFFGCRLNELCQLDTADIFKNSGLYCLKISPDNRDVSAQKEEHKQTKTHNTRILPLPDKIIELGFLEYVKSRKKNNKEKLFDLKYNKNNHYTKYMGSWFARYLDKINIISETKVFHSFRHNLTLNMKTIGYPESYTKEIGGWSDSKREAFSYYNNSNIPLRNLKEAIDKLEFPMIDWGKLKNRPTDIPKNRAYHRSVIHK